MTEYEMAARAARSSLKEKGWAKGPDLRKEGPWCLSIALANTSANYHHVAIRAMEIAEQLAPGSTIGTFTQPSIVYFNDRPETTWEDVSLLLKHLEES